MIVKIILVSAVGETGQQGASPASLLPSWVIWSPHWEGLCVSALSEGMSCHSVGEPLASELSFPEPWTVLFGCRAAPSTDSSYLPMSVWKKILDHLCPSGSVCALALLANRV